MREHLPESMAVREPGELRMAADSVQYEAAPEVYHVAERHNDKACGRPDEH